MRRGKYEFTPCPGGFGTIQGLVTLLCLYTIDATNDVYVLSLQFNNVSAKIVVHVYDTCISCRTCSEHIQVPYYYSDVHLYEVSRVNKNISRSDFVEYGHTDTSTWYQL
jgi:hypothetical protein